MGMTDKMFESRKAYLGAINGNKDAKGRVSISRKIHKDVDLAFDHYHNYGFGDRTGSSWVLNDENKCLELQELLEKDIETDKLRGIKIGICEMLDTVRSTEQKDIEDSLISSEVTEGDISQALRELMECDEIIQASVFGSDAYRLTKTGESSLYRKFRCEDNPVVPSVSYNDHSVRIQGDGNQVATGSGDNVTNKPDGWYAKAIAAITAFIKCW